MFLAFKYDFVIAKLQLINILHTTTNAIGLRSYVTFGFIPITCETFLTGTGLTVLYFNADSEKGT